MQILYPLVWATACLQCTWALTGSGKEKGPEGPLRRAQERSDQTLGNHGVSHLDKAGDIRAVDIAHAAVFALAVLHAG